MLRLDRDGTEKGPTAVYVPDNVREVESRTSIIRQWSNKRPGAPRRQPTLEIMKTQEIEQVSYAAGEEPQGSECSTQRTPDAVEFR